MQNCPCGSQKNYAECCELFLSGKQSAPTPEALMRSRYTAYTKADIDYIARTMKAPANKDFKPDETRLWAQQVDWKKLEVVSAKTENDKGFVEFFAFYYQNGQSCVLHELSEFQLLDGHWFYISGKTPKIKSQARPSIKISRNDPCSCGSNKKYKKCCGQLA